METQKSQTSEFLNDEIKRLRKNFFETRQTFDLKFRKEQLLKIKQAWIKNEKELCGAVLKDLGGSDFVSWGFQYSGIIGHIDDFIRNLDEWSSPTCVDSPVLCAPMKSYIEYNPLGVVCIYGCWNFPLVLTVEPLLAAIAAGNCAMVKLSEISPSTEKILEVVLRSCLDDRFYGVYTGGVETSSALSALPFDKILFTGGTNVGIKIAMNAAPNLTPLCLELGGKNVTIVDKSCDVPFSAAKIMWARNLNSGQICMCPDYIIIHSSIKDQFLSCCKEEIKKQYGTTMEEHLAGDMGHMINISGVNRFKKILNEDHGGEVIVGGEWNEEKLYCAPTIILDPRLDSLAMQVEAFSPILSVIVIDDIEETIEFINNRPKPLSMYFFGATMNNERLNKIRDYTASGALVINDCFVQYLNTALPFGGIGKSGMGTYMGKHGFMTFSHAKPVIYRPSSDPVSILNAPYIKTQKFLKPSLKLFSTWSQMDALRMNVNLIGVATVCLGTYAVYEYGADSLIKSVSSFFGF